MKFTFAFAAFGCAKLAFKAVFHAVCNIITKK